MKQPAIRMFSTDPKDEAIGRFGIFQPLGCWSKFDRSLKSEKLYGFSSENLDKRDCLMLGKKFQTYAPKWWFNGDLLR